MNPTPTMDLKNATSFIETQFPVAKLSMESYKERKAGASQTLTGLGRWWGRKPLVLVRAALLGLLLPATDDPRADRDVFLRLMTMDPEGLRRRKSKAIPGRRLLAALRHMPPGVQRRFLHRAPGQPPALKRLSNAERAVLQEMVFDRLPYSEKLRYCDRPEQIDGPSPEAWEAINAHLGTAAHSLPELVAELGRRRFGRRPRVGDAFCGGGSVPFEAARLGCDAYGSDLNPVAALLTWGALNIVGGGADVAEEVAQAQADAFAAADRQITAWGIEHNSLGWRADAYLYCVEVVDPESGWRVPLAPSWVIGKRTRTIARLVPDPANKRYAIEIVENASQAEMQAARQGTVRNSRLVPPDGGPSTPIAIIRRDLRAWENHDLTPRPDDVFQERLYCVRWVETYVDDQGREQTRRHYRAATRADRAREERVLRLLRDRLYDWQQKGFIPSRRIEPGDETTRLMRERGWTHWHHLFTPRQLLLLGLFGSMVETMPRTKAEAIQLLLGLGRLTNYNSRLCRWHPSRELVADVFSNQALNTNYDFGSRALTAADTTWFTSTGMEEVAGSVQVALTDCRKVAHEMEIWLSDPPYADAVNYDELSEFFLAWYDKRLGSLFPQWHSDSRRDLAVTGSDHSFRQSMVECYQRLAAKMPDDGMQIVMFTHQDAGVWADLSLILWAAGLRVTAAWTISTETPTALRTGNYVQGTVLLVLRKRTAAQTAFLDEIMPRMEREVRRQLDAMTHLDDASDPNFGDADYQLAAYAAALRVLTAQPIYEIDPVREIERPRPAGEVGPVEALIRTAVAIACDHLVPRHIAAPLWRRLTPLERFYLKGLEMESHGEYRSGVYQELARGFGAADYAELLANTRANETRLKSATELGRRGLGGGGFGGTLLRHCLYAVYRTGREETTEAGLNWLKTELPDYWRQRERILALLDFLAGQVQVSTMPHWQGDGRAAGLLAGAVRNDHV